MVGCHVEGTSATLPSLTPSPSSWSSCHALPRAFVQVQYIQWVVHWAYVCHVYKHIKMDQSSPKSMAQGSRP